MHNGIPVLTPIAMLIAAITGDALSQAAPPNVLLIAVDDLRPELGCYGSRIVRSPHIDALAESGRLFERAYCQQAVCNPSRTSLMTGLRPDSSGVTGNHVHFRSIHPDIVTLPQHFKQHGYHAQSIGKIYHGVFPEGASKTRWDTMGDPQSWSVPTTRFGPRYYFTESGIEQAQQAFLSMYRPKNPKPTDWTEKLVFGPMTESPDVGDETLYDGKVARAAVETLDNLKNSDQPFFLAIGFIKPHSPFVAPKKYFDLYNAEDLPLASRDSLPEGAPEFAGHGSGEIRRYTDQPGRGPIPDANARRMRHAYYACISFIDAQIGRVLAALDESGLAENTIVALFGDHGYHLGEHGLWGKTTNFELDTRVPLIIRAPGMVNVGRPTQSITELVALYPTLATLAGLPVPEHCEGRIVSDFVDSPTSGAKDFALSQYPRGSQMGYSLRTDRWRYTEWIESQTGTAAARELYDHGSDDPVETVNLAQRAEHSETVRRLSKQLRRSAGLRTEPERPNILLIVGEDHGCELSCYGDPVVETPHIDRLAEQGMLFENGYVTQSVCSPSRSTIFTGLYPHQNGQLGLATHQFRWFEQWPTTYSLLKRSGYRTGLIGKTHILPVDAVEPFVDFRFQKGSNFAKKNVSDYAVEAGKFFRESDAPFFMTVNYPDAHWPLQNEVGGLPTTRVPEERVQVMPYVGVETPRLRKIAQNYYDCMLRLDECVGQLLSQLKDSGKADNTLVVFVGDHGAQMARGKVTVYEGGMRVPYILRWPGVIPRGLRSQALVSTIDLLPTFADAAGFAPPKGIPGKSLREAFTGASDKDFREFLVCERNCDAAHTTFPQRTIRDEQYKLIFSPIRDREDPAARYYREHGATHWSGCPTDEELEQATEQVRAGHARWLRPPEFQLYDLHADPCEWNDLAGNPAHADTKSRLQTALTNWMESTNDPIRDSEKLATLMRETDAVNAAKRKSPVSGWKYLDYWRPTGNRSGKEAFPADEVLFRTSFEKGDSGRLHTRSEGSVTLHSTGTTRINTNFAHTGNRSLRMLGDANNSLILELSSAFPNARGLSFRAERWTKRSPFGCVIDIRQEGEWIELTRLDDIRVGARFRSHVRVSLPDQGKIEALRVRVTAADGGGLLIDDLTLLGNPPD